MIPSRALYDAIALRFGDPDRWVEHTLRRMETMEITKAQLARRSGIEPTHISRYLGKNRSVRPSMETMVLLDEAIEHLIQGE